MTFLQFLLSCISTRVDGCEWSTMFSDAPLILNNSGFCAALLPSGQRSSAVNHFDGCMVVLQFPMIYDFVSVIKAKQINI